MNSSHRPCISIGVPVYNGENFLSEALDSLLAQTYQDFEIIISDNASTDRTEDICREYAAQDARIRYYRQHKNVGPSQNFNTLVSLARGKYFKWLSHDDMCAPDCLDKCVKVLEWDPTVIMAASHVRLIDAHGEDFYGNDPLHKDCNNPLRMDSVYAHQRFADAIFKNNSFFLFFGLLRPEILKQTPLMGATVSADVILVARLALLGRFHILPEQLFMFRNHADQATQIALSDITQYTGWFDASKKGKITFPRWRVFYEHCVSIASAPISPKEKLYCWLHLGRWFLHNSRFLVQDIEIAIKKSLKAYLKSFIRLTKNLTQHMTKIAVGARKG